ncbi:single-stranded-DNA-specific exonuclease RecJ [Bermanella marisrubri]|uniref:Single-stranded-DNA-specific exonuclease RecJ n=1 Tax=Bermanella marisrubri TaxID=207949 RepID=Q1N0E3_9GAMM|nr:single-stranded-DNA-specific exonuclease RecJ [Bermanella marisrubri]EAT11721.1 single-stranded-DNA-specific exonuclease RecJ [Oceanobacter sp. RED65] [Bermanella marisrubri]QIZ83244.1 single-stranded-DNA-specific exonuclease RecJ [Bermanella marisrubri]
MTSLITRRFSNPELPIIERVLDSRGLKTGDLSFSLNQLAGYQALKGIDQAVAMLEFAIRSQQRIVIIGDFDADGATSTALAVDALQQLGAHWVHYLVPNRFEFGYGLSSAIAQLAYEQYQPDLLVTVDNGISSFEGVETAHELGMKVLVTDHHLAADSLPNADAIVNPNQPDCLFPSKAACGCAVVFYVMCALRAHRMNLGDETAKNLNMAQYLDLVALATVADVVPLDRNNQILVEQGLRRIRAGQARPGVQALLQVAKRQAPLLTSKDFGFALGPRLNAAGRMDDMSIGIECLLSKEFTRAVHIAETLDELNQDRKSVEGQMQKEALKILETTSLSNEQEQATYCLYHPQWHQGVVGLLASRIKEKLFRPVIAFAPASDDVTNEALASGEFEIKGSGRSIPGFHMRDALDLVAKRLPHVLQKFGGHAMAAGLSIQQKHLKEFETCFEQVARDIMTADMLVNEIITDGEPNYEDYNVHIARQLKFVAPWGQNFPEPIFDGEFDVINYRLIGSEKNHLKLTLASKNHHRYLDAILFSIERHGLSAQDVSNLSRVHIVFDLDVNEFRGQENVQLMIRHLRSI